MRYAVILLTLFLTACAVGPTYHRPVVQIPDTFRGPEPVAALEGDSLADLKWFAVLGVTQSNQYPNVAAVGDVRFTRLSRDGSFALPPTFVPSQNRNWGEAFLGLLSFEVDIWGRLRRATEAARANLLAAEENRKAVMTTLVADVAANYFSLRELDYELEISQRT